MSLLSESAKSISLSLELVNFEICHYLLKARKCRPNFLFSTWYSLNRSLPCDTTAKFSRSGPSRNQPAGGTWSTAWTGSCTTALEPRQELRWFTPQIICSSNQPETEVEFPTWLWCWLTAEPRTNLGTLYKWEATFNVDEWVLYKSQVFLVKNDDKIFHSRAQAATY